LVYISLSLNYNCIRESESAIFSLPIPANSGCERTGKNREEDIFFGANKKYCEYD
jgi:hypothetical protein